MPLNHVPEAVNSICCPCFTAIPILCQYTFAGTRIGLGVEVLVRVDGAGVSVGIGFGVKVLVRIGSGGVSVGAIAGAGEF